MSNGSDTLTVVYDLSVAPTSFDCATFMSLAELHRRASGYEHMRVVFVPAAGTRFWDREEIGALDKEARLQKLLMPISTLWPSCARVDSLHDREDARSILRAAGNNLFPVGYALEAPVADTYQWAHVVAAHACGQELPGWQAPPKARATVDTWLAPRAMGRRVITITLREATYFTEQNSNLNAWCAFAGGLDTERYFPVFVRDIEKVAEPPSDVLAPYAIFPEASVDVQVRAALYERSYLCPMSPTGPMLLLWTNPHCRSLVFGMVRPQLFRNAPVPIRAMGIEFGAQNPASGIFNRLAWQLDTEAAIRVAFTEMVELIDGGDEGQTAQISKDWESPSRIARLLRTAGRVEPARRVYLHIRGLRVNPVIVAAARAGLALIDNGGAMSISVLDRIIDFFPHASPFLLRATIFSRSRYFDPDALLDVVDWYVKCERPNVAAVICAALLARQPDHPEGNRLAGEVYLRLGAPEPALRHLAHAAKLQPESAAARYAHGIALLVHGRDREAETEFHAAALDDPSHEGTRRRLNDLKSNLPLPNGFTYRDTLARRPSHIVGNVEEISYPIMLPETRCGYHMVYFRGLFYAVPEMVGRFAINSPPEHGFRLIRPLGTRLRHAAARLSKCLSTSVSNLKGASSTATVQNLDPPSDFFTSAPTLTQLERLIALRSAAGTQ